MPVNAMHVNFLNFDVPFSLGGGRPNIYTKLKCLSPIKHSDLHTLLILIIVKILMKNLL